ncbi:MAG: hypothetical protein MZV70_60905 [Desulfobacterales bacterium]|nr:hypothetical protein [Desulfobacterales bacterium]
MPGSGIRAPGRRPDGTPGGRRRGLALDLLLTHTHLDHILGLPFFQPALPA